MWFHYRFHLTEGSLMLVQLLGDVGSGKTLFATFLALKESRPVYSNYKIDIPKYHALKPEMIAKMHKPALIIIDEAYRWLESRTSGSHLNRYMSYNLFQHRKKGVDIVLTDQLEETIDLRYRLMTNYEIHCNQIPDIGFQYLIYKHSTFKRYHPISIVMPYSFAETLYPLFNSWEEQPIDESLLFNITEDKTDILKDVDKIVDFLLSKAEASQYKKGDVADFCLRQGYPKEYVPIAFNALKARRFDSPKDFDPTEPFKARYRLRSP